MAAAFKTTSLSCLSTASGPAFCHQHSGCLLHVRSLSGLHQGEEVCPSCLQSTHSSIHPPFGSEMNPFSDRWLVARGLQTKPQAAGPGGGNNPQLKSPPSLNQRKKEYKMKRNKN